MNVADEAIADEIDRRGPEARAQVRQEYAAGALASVDAAMARFEELMQPTTAARTALHAIDRSLRIAEAALDLWADGGADFLGKAACLLGQLLAFSRLLAEMGVEVPDDFGDAVSILSVITTTACPAPVAAETP